MSSSTEITRKKCGQIYILSNDKFSLICEFCEREFFELELLRTHIGDHFPEEPTTIKIEKCEIDSTPRDIQDDIIDLTSDLSNIDEVKDAMSPVAECQTTADNLVDLRMHSNQFSEQNNGRECRSNLKECCVVLQRISEYTHSTGPTARLRKRTDANQTNDSTDLQIIESQSSSVPKISDGPKILKKGFKCSFCPRIFRQRRDHRDHENAHTGKRPYNCRICSKTFGSTLTLYSHLNLVHINDRKYECTMCKKSFKTNSKLSYHTRENHLPDTDPRRWFPCDQCDHKSKTSAGRQIHLRKIHQKNAIEFTCDYCQKIYKWKEYLRKHIMSQHLDREREPSNCNYCYKKFVDIKGRNRHERQFCGNMN